MRDTASTMRCRACGEEVGSSFLYSADGFAYHHECFPGNNVDKADARDAIAAKNAEISRLAADNEALRKERDEARAEIERMTPKFVAYEYLEAPDRREASESRADALAQALRNLCTAYAACNGEDHPAYKAARRALGERE